MSIVGRRGGINEKICIFIDLLLLLRAKVSAKWQSVPADSIERFFVEKRTIKKSQNSLEFWLLTNYSPSSKLAMIQRIYPKNLSTRLTVVRIN
jgi:hypothetical protein